MTSFTEVGLNKRLKKLNCSQQSIETLSLWLIHHRKYAPTVVKIWLSGIFAGSEYKQLALMYLANDVIQNSKRKGPEYGLEFGKELAQAFKYIALNNCSTKTRQSLTRLLSVWKDRSVYTKIQIAEFKKSFESKTTDEPPKTKLKHSLNQKSKETQSKNNGIKKDEEVKVEVDGTEEVKVEVDGTEEVKVEVDGTEEVKVEVDGTEEIKVEVDGTEEIKVEVDGTEEFRFTLSPKTPVNDPPEPEQLFIALNVDT